ncbi:MAG: OmpH family outer membrane protein [bacterium]
MHIGSKIVCALFVIAGLLAVAPKPVNAQAVKLGYVSDERIKSEYRAWQKAQETWELEAKAWEDEAVTMQQEVQDLIDEYEKQKLILSDEKKQEKEAAINSKRDMLDAYTRDIYGPSGKAEQRQAQLVDGLIETINRAIEAVAVEENYDVIFTSLSALGYIRPSYDVTDKVLEKLDEIE